jgi:hypothetical protein
MFKGLNARRLYKSFGVTGLMSVVYGPGWSSVPLHPSPQTVDIKHKITICHIVHVAS